MPFPPEIETVTVHGKIIHADPDATPANGYLRFRTPNVLRDANDALIAIQTTYNVTLDSNGEFTVELPATNSPGINPTNWAIQVYINTDAWREQFYVQLDYLVPTVEFVDLLPASIPTTYVTYATVTYVDAGDAATLAAANAYTDAEIASIGSGVTSVNGMSGVVVLDAADVGAADDSAVVHNTGNEGVAGVKTFSSAPVVPANSFPQTAVVNLTTDLAAKATDSLVVHLAGVENITGAKTFTANPVFNAGGIAQASVANLTTDLAAKAADSTVVHNTGNENIGGIKTFTGAPIVPANSFPESAVTNLVADLASKATDSLVVHLAGAENITGAKTFTANPIFNAGGIAQASVANLVTDLAAKATDSLVVHKAGVESITGVKTFTADPVFNAAGIAQASVANLVTDLASKVPTTRTITAGTAMTGGGDLSANRTLNVNVGTGSSQVANGQAPYFAFAPWPISGRYIYTGYGATATVVPTLNQARYTPFPVWVPFSFTSIAVEVTTLQATSVIRLGLYADNGSGLPGSLVTDYGTVSGGATGVQTITPGSPVALTQGLWWLCAVVQVIGGTLALRSGNTHDPLILPSTNTITNAAINAYVQAGVAGALGSPAVAADASGGPRFILQIT